MSKWWCLQHFNSPTTFPAKLLTVFGVPLCSVFFKATGPFKSKQEAEDWISEQT